MADVAVIVDGNPAYIHADCIAIRPEILFLPAQRTIDFHKKLLNLLQLPFALIAQLFFQFRNLGLE